MNAAIIAIITLVLGFMPLLFTHPRRAAMSAACSFFPLWGFYYLVLPSMAWPLGGVVGLMVFIGWIASPLINTFADDEPSQWSWWVPRVGALAYVASVIICSGMMRSGDYRSLIGDVEKREWTQNVQPKDPRHVRLVPHELAYYLATKQLGEVPGAIGSQFQVETDTLTLQMIHGELWYVAPLNYKGYRAWTSAEASPGYVMVHGEDPKRPVIVKTGLKMKYLPSAFLGDNLERLLWKKYGNRYALADFTFEIDESGKPWWTITAYQPTIVWGGKKARGVIVVDPVDGDDVFYKIGEVPQWIDRAIPGKFVERYVWYYGEYVKGWVNSWWGHDGIFKPEEPKIAYGSDGEPYWVTSITSANENDKAMIGLVYTDVRTGKSVMYHASGGTEEAVVELVNNKVSYRKLHGCSSQLYNVYGVMTSVVPLLGESHSYQGVAFVDVANMQLAVGDDIESTLRQYQRMLATSGQQVALEKASDLKVVAGVVSRFAPEIRGGETMYYLYCEETPHVFTGGGDVSPKLRLTKVGDRVQIQFVDSQEDIVPIVGFDNPSIALTQTVSQAELKGRVAERQEEVRTVREAKTTRAELEQMSDQELKELMKLRKK